MNILITGGNGFLGSNLTKKLLSEGHSLYVFSKEKNNISNILDQIQFGYGHAKEIINFKNEIARFSPDLVLYCGWSGGNSYTDINSVKQFYNNVEPGIAFIEMLKDLPKKPKFVGFGTILEYGTHTSPIDESFEENPIDLYGLSKHTFKNYSKMLCDFYGLEWMWLRLGYNYGPHDVKTRLIPSLINKCLKNEDIVLDECKRTIDYLYVDDFVELVCSLITTNSTGIYNVSSGRQYVLKDIINDIHRLSNSSSKIIFDPKLNRKFASQYVCIDNSKIIKTTGIVPKTDLETGLLKTINYYKNEL
jgi:nucleoside-diphosphate-sugar epimerase